VDGQARRSGTRRRRQLRNRGLVGLHAQVSAVAQRSDDLPSSDSIGARRRVGLRHDRFVIAFGVIVSRPRASGAGQHGSPGSATKSSTHTSSAVWRSAISGDELW
jgi:hypothetical protein